MTVGIVHPHSFRQLLSHLTFNAKYLHTGQRLLSKPTDPRDKRDKFDRERLRNIGFVAHINAGKTTTTERVLYLAGSTDTVGDVDKGNTITDYLVQERDRGITITSAAVSFDWKKHRINLIDTPGHIDFTVEVERSLSVLDGAVTIIDASAGVEAQTITVWNQSRKYKLPNILFLNKYDKPKADYRMCLRDLRTSLEINASMIQLPVITKQGFFSVVDIIKRQCLSWTNPNENNGSEFSAATISNSHKFLDKKFIDMVEEQREVLINSLTDIDDELANHVLDCDRISTVSGDQISRALRRATLSCQIYPVLVGSSYKYIGVQQLLDAIISYLPSPIEREKFIRNSFGLESGIDDSASRHTCGFIFKIMHDKRLGALNYLRIYNGAISKLQLVKCLGNDKPEQVKKVYRAFGDELREIDWPVGKDDIVVATGLIESRTGDILVDRDFYVDIDTPSTKIDVSNDDNDKVTNLPFQLLRNQIIVPQINRLEQVYFCSIESKSSAEQIKLEHALACLSREDPSFTFGIDELGITTIRGMGKLHLEVIRDRIQSEYGVSPLLGPLQISYRETIDGSATEELTVDRLVNAVNNSLEIKLYIRSKPKAGVWSAKRLRLDTSGDGSLTKLRHDHRRAIDMGFASAMAHGPSLGYPLIDCDIVLLGFKANRRCGLPIISSAASQCLTAAIRRCSPVLLEPIMLLEVVVPRSYNGTVLSDITARRGIILTNSARDNGTMVIRSHTPLSMLTDYSEFLRISTSGRGIFSMELYSYSAMK